MVKGNKLHLKPDTPSTKVQYYLHLSSVAQYGTLTLPPLPGRVITRNWNSDYANDLNWLPLSTRRDAKAQGLLQQYMYSIILIHTSS